MNRWTRSSVKNWKEFPLSGETLILEQDGIRIDDGDNKVPGPVCLKNF